MREGTTAFSGCGAIMRTSILTAVMAVGCVCPTAAAPLIYSGNTVVFTKAPFAEPSNPASQDLILPGVSITRANTRGIYNTVQESSYINGSSPVGTEWAFANNNPATDVTASNWEALAFTDWETALGGSQSLSTAILDGNAVVHLTEQDIYLDIRFTSWGVGSGSGGGFSYERAEITPSADFDRDGNIDGQDFLIWQRGFSAAAPSQSSGDANFDGAVDGADLEAWQMNYPGVVAAARTVPEPGSIPLVLAGVLAAGAGRRLR